MTVIADMLAQALAYHRSGQLAQAEERYREILHVDPCHVDALQLCGVVAFQTGRSELAATFLREALRHKPDFAEVHSNLGHLLTQQGQFDEAIACCRQAIQLKPDYAEAHYNLGNALRASGKPADAVACYQQAIRLNPTYWEACLNLGNALMDSGNLAEAAISYRETIRRKPECAEAHHDLAAVLKDLGASAEAMAAYREALRLKPDFAEAHIGLAVVLDEQNQLQEAAVCLREGLRLKPLNAEAHNRLGLILQKLDRLEEAEAAFREAIRLKPEVAGEHYNLGSVLLFQGNLRGARDCYEHALRIEPSYADAHLGKGIACLLAGDYEQGWPEYEWRLRCKNFSSPFQPPSAPLWDGSPLHGRTIFLRGEQGLGDTIWFIRYAPLVKKRGGRVVVGCQKPLTRLLQSCAGIDQIVTADAPLPALDVQAPLLSLPLIFGTTTTTIPAEVPYLAAEPSWAKVWRRALGESSFKVGIAWQGSPTFALDRRRSIPLEHFTALAGVPGVQFFSLQNQHGLEQIPKVADRLGLIDLSSRLDVAFGPFMDTAAVMMNLDLVIAPDTVVAPLAGALGVPVWVALPFAPYWAWLLEREDSPWFPSARLFRQREPGNWSEVFERMACELKKLVKR